MFFIVKRKTAYEMRISDRSSDVCSTDLKNAKATVEWYEAMLGMTYTTVFAKNHVPSTGEYDTYMHVFLDAGGGNILAFFELPNQPAMGRDENPPAWLQHLAFQVGSY